MGLIAFMVALALGVPARVLAQSVPHTFQDGEVADAEQVNENFSAVLEANQNRGASTFQTGTASVRISHTSSDVAGDAGFIDLRDANGESAVRFSTATAGGGGWVGLFDADDRSLVRLFVAEADTPSEANGTIVMLNQSNQGLVLLSEDEESGGGLVRVCDASGQTCSNLTSTEKDFLVPHPGRPDRAIRYAAIEGPEAAMYIRGTARLKEGRGVVQFPEPFRSLAAPEGLTVLLTPHSPSSLGLARTRLTPGLLEVEELEGGKGSYAFDYLVHAVRRGSEDYDVLVEDAATRRAPAPGIDRR